jgi:uncharacterized membrane protein
MHAPTILRHVGWTVAALAAYGMAGYAVTQQVVGAEMYPGLLRESFLARPWGIVPHALCGAIALLVGPWQFLPATYRRRPRLHRACGWIYLFSAFGTGLAGLYMSSFAYTGAAAQAGFVGMALATLICPAFGLRAVKRADYVAHRAWMVRSFAMIFAAVTFRIWIPILSYALGSFDAAYPWITWASWVPNLLWAAIWLRLYPTPQ